MYLPVLSVILLSITLPHASAQTTSITSLQSPTHALTGKGGTVTVAVSYNRGSNGAVLAVDIFDIDTGAFAVGSAKSSQNTCLPNTGQYSNAALCLYVPTSTSGTDVVTFSLQFYSARTYRLFAAVLFSDSSLNIISDSYTTRVFTILVTDKLSLTVNAPVGVSVSIDGAQQNSGKALVNVDPGQHTISVPDTVPLDNDTRLRFDRWRDGGTQTSRTVNLQNDATFEAVYIIQYNLGLQSPQVSATGAGWYDDGSSAAFSVPAIQPMSGVLGSLGGRWVFQGWYEAQQLVSKSSATSITITGAHHLTAHWTADYTSPLIIIGMVALVVILALVALQRRKKPNTPRRTKARDGEKSAERAEKIEDKSFCLNCGAELPLKSKFCNKCGSAQT